MLQSISIHSLRMEGDLVYTPFRGNRAYFNPLPPHGGRQLGRSGKALYRGISIHSLRMEGDLRFPA